MENQVDTAGAVAAYLNPEINEPAQAAKASMQVAVDANPDFEAELRRASARTGVPLDAARAYPEDVKRQAMIEAQDFDQLSKTYPTTTRFLTEPENARISHDDIENLSQTESTIGPIVGPKPDFFSVVSGLAKSLPQGGNLALQGMRIQLADLFGFDAVRRDAQERYSRADLERADSTPDIKGATASAVYGGASSTIRMIPGLAASLSTRSTAPMLATMGVQTGSEAYGKYRNRGGTAVEALAGGALEGGIEVATEMLPMGYLVQNLGRVKAGHFLTGLLAREIPGEQLATLTQDAVDTAIANPDKTWGEYLAERPGAAYQTLVATITQASIMGGLNAAAGRVTGRQQQAEHANTIGDALQQLNSLAEASKVRERDTNTAQQFFQSLTGEGRDSVWITPEALQASGMAEQIIQAVPGVAEQLRTAIDSGTDIRLPIADLMTNLAGQELAQSIIPHLADEPGGFTQTTASEYLKSGAAQELQAEVQRVTEQKQQDDAFTASRNVVTQQIATQLDQAARFTPEVNQAYATMAGNFYAVQAAKLGITPEEMAARYPLQVRAEALPGARTLDQPQQPEFTVSGNLPARGLAPANLSSTGVLYVGEPNSLHFIVAGQAPENDRDFVSTGFVTPDGQYLDRDQALEWVNTNEKKIRQSANMDEGLDSADYREQVPESMRKGAVQQEARGSMSISEDITQNPTIITLLQKANLTTFNHELGHFFLEVQAHIAAQPDAPAGIVDDMAKTLDWFGVPDLATWDAMDLEQKRPYHEQFARGFEAYLFEGKAPNPELQPLFARFRAWMVSVYKSLTALDVTLTDEVRGVFDRMVASTESITEAEADQGLEGMFRTKPAFMQDDEWRAYQELSIDATQDAITQLEQRSLRDMKWLANAKARILRDMQREAAERRKTVRAEVEKEVMAEPVNQARQFLRRGLNPDGTPAPAAHKLAIASLTEMYGGEGDRFALLDWSKLGYGAYGALAETGLSPDALAEIVGYPSGDAMVRELLTAPPARAVIEDQTNQRMLERYGDLKDQTTIDAAINLALVGEARARFVATELNALNKATGRAPVLAAAAKSYAAAAIARLKVSELRPDVFLAAARRAAKASQAALAKDDLQLAAVEKQNHLINTYAARAALDAKTEMAKTLQGFNKIARGNNEKVSKTRDLDMVMATRAILAEFGIGTRGKAASEYLKAVEAYDPEMSAVLVDRIQQVTAGALPFRELTIEQVRGLKDEIDSLMYLAKRSRQMEVDGDLMDRQDVQDQLRARLEEMGIPEVVPGEGKAITEGETMIARLQSLRASLRRVEAWTDARDGAGTKMGPFRRYIFSQVKDAADNYRADKAKFLRQYRELLDPIAKTLTATKIAAPEIGYTFGFDKGGAGKAELLHAILHTGNESNMKKMLLGRNWASLKEDGTLDTTRWDTFINRMISEGRLTKADFDFAQGVWDLLESMKPLAQKTHREVFGRYFDEVTATPFENQFGKYAGGYVPAMADSRIVADARTRALAESENATLQASFPQTSRGFTKSRVEYNRPLMLDLRTISQHIDKVLLFSHLEQPVREVRKVLTSSQIAGPLNRIDPTAFDSLLTPWLHRASRQQVESPVDGSWGNMRIFAVLRARAGMAAMFANVNNTLQQITGFSVAALKVSPRYLGPAAVDYLRSPAAATEAIAAVSPYMRLRMENEVQALSGIINDILINPSTIEKVQAWTSKHAYFLQSAVDNVMSPIIWQGAYNQAMETAPAGMSQAALELYARRLADSSVRETQGSTLPEDISRIETGNAFVRMFTQFYGYFNMVANLNATELVKISEEVGLRKGAGRGLYVLFFGLLAPAWVAQAIALAFRGGPDDDDKDGAYWDDWLAQTFGWGTLRNLTAMVPVAGQVINAAANTANGKPYDDKISTSPAISMLESAGKAPKSVYTAVTGQGGEGKAVRDVATLISMATGIPALGLAKPLIYGADVAAGRTRPLGPADAARGVITGTSSPESKQR